MANKLVDAIQLDADLTSIADAIREKSGTSAELSFPDDFVEAIGDISGGGDIPIITRADWNAMTTAQKQSYGLACVQDAMTGFVRGQFINGADYLPIYDFLPYSDSSTLLCLAYPELYDETSLTWGAGNNPVNFSVAGSVQNADGSIAIKTKTAGTLAYVDLGAERVRFTAYIVAKVTNYNSAYTRLLSSMAARASRSGILLYGNTDVKVSSWGDDSKVSPSVNPMANYFVGAISFGSESKGGAISGNYSPTLISKSPSTTGRYITIGRTDINSSETNAEPTDMDVLFLGVTSVTEDAEVISNNMISLAQRYLSN